LGAVKIKKKGNAKGKKQGRPKERGPVFKAEGKKGKKD